MKVIVLDHNFVLRHVVGLYISVKYCIRSQFNWIDTKNHILGYTYVATYDASVCNFCCKIQHIIQQNVHMLPRLTFDG